MPEPYYVDEFVTLYHGDCRELLDDIDFDSIYDDSGIIPELAIADPPYGETSLPWDAWPDDWPSIAADYVNSLWCFGSFRMYLNRAAEFECWKLSQDIIWEKHNGASFHADRFARVHETLTHWYRGAWSDIYHQTPKTMDARRRTVRRKDRPAHTGHIGESTYTSEDGGPRLQRSVIYCRSMHGRALNETEKPTGLVEQIVEYGCPAGGLILDLFTGSGSVLEVAKARGCRAIGFEAREEQCEIAARRLAQDVLPFEEAADVH